MNPFGEQTDKDSLTLAQRWTEPITVLVMLLVFGFFLYHQVTQTGFFTARFGTGEMIWLYGPLLCSFAAPIVRTVMGQRNPARPCEVATNLFLAGGAAWLLQVFPFNFAHLADALPGTLHFLLAWVTNDLGKIALILQIIVCPLVAVVTLWIYLARRRRAPARPWSRQPL